MKLLAFISLLALSFSCSACEFNFADDPFVRNAVKARGRYPVSDQQCALLNKNGLALSVSGNATVLRGVSIAWAEVRLVDLKTQVTSTLSRSSINVNTGDASQDTANGLLYDAVSDAVRGLDFEVVVTEINTYRTKVKTPR